jgi:hypothetical protein
MLQLLCWEQQVMVMSLMARMLLQLLQQRGGAESAELHIIISSSWAVLMMMMVDTLVSQGCARLGPRFTEQRPGPVLQRLVRLEYHLSRHNAQARSVQAAQELSKLLLLLVEVVRLVGRRIGWPVLCGDCLGWHLGACCEVMSHPALAALQPS